MGHLPPAAAPTPVDAIALHELGRGRTRCDASGVETAAAVFRGPAGTLAFCLHHADRLQTDLFVRGFTVVADVRPKLYASAGAFR